MDNATIVLSGNPTFNAPITINICRGECSKGDKLPSQSTSSTTSDDTDYLPLKRSKVKDYRSHRGDKKYYQIVSYPKGRVLLINNEFFEESCDRAGSSKDFCDMHDLWHKMGCKVISYKDLSAEHLLQSVETFSKAADDADFYVVIIMSHGREDDLIVGSDNGAEEVENIVKMIVESDQMKGKPKLIFFQMCRGNNVQKDLDSSTQTDASTFSTEDSSWINTLMHKVLENGRVLGSNATETDALAEEYLNSTQDVMLAFATQPGHLSFRDPHKGSWFIQSIKKAFATYSAIHDVRTLMEMVQEDLKKNTAYAPGTDFDQGKVTMDGCDTFGKKMLKLFPGFPKPQKEL